MKTMDEQLKTLYKRKDTIEIQIRLLEDKIAQRYKTKPISIPNSKSKLDIFFEKNKKGIECLAGCRVFRDVLSGYNTPGGAQYTKCLKITRENGFLKIDLYQLMDYEGRESRQYTFGITYYSPQAKVYNHEDIFHGISNYESDLINALGNIL